MPRRAERRGTSRLPLWADFPASFLN